MEFAEKTFVELEDIEEEFMKNIMNIDQYFTTDLSVLHDFSLCGIPTEMISHITEQELETQEKYNLACAIWEKYILEKISNTYHIHIPNTSVTIQEILEKIWETKATVQHLH